MAMTCCANFLDRSRRKARGRLTCRREHAEAGPGPPRRRRALAESEAEAAFDIIMSGEATPAQIGGLLMAMRVRGETVPELTGAVRAMRARMLAIEAPAGAIDIVGTGGDASGTPQHLHRDVASWWPAAACRWPSTATARCRRNRARPMRCRRSASTSMCRWTGSRRCWPRPACVFLMAPRHHSAHAPCRRPAGRAGHPDHLQPARPAGQSGAGEAAAHRRLRRGMGAADGARRWRGSAPRRAWVVHGQGLDEIDPVRREPGGRAGRTARSAGSPSRPEDAGLERAPPEAIRGGEPAVNAAALTALLHGAPAHIATSCC